MATMEYYGSGTGYFGQRTAVEILVNVMENLGEQS